MSRRSYAILGTGALGGTYGGRLAHAGFDTHFLLRSDFEHVRDRGLRVDSIRGDFQLPSVNAYGDPADLPACDVAVVCLKTTQNDQLPELLAHCVKPDGVVLVLQNGLHPEADAAAVVGDDRVLGGLCFLCSNKVGPGHIQHLDYGHIHLGVYQPQAGDSPAAAHFPGVVEDFNAAGIDTTAVDDLRLSRWKKLVWNIPYNGLSVVLNQTTDVMMADPPTRRRIEAVMAEVQAAALAVDGKVIEDAFIETMLDYTSKMKPYKTSMMLDFEAGREIEIEAIVGDPIKAIKNCPEPPPVPLLEKIERELWQAVGEKWMASQQTWLFKGLIYGSMIGWIALGVLVARTLTGSGHRVLALVFFVMATLTCWFPAAMYIVGQRFYLQTKRSLFSTTEIRWNDIQAITALRDEDRPDDIWLQLYYSDPNDAGAVTLYGKPGFERVLRRIKKEFPEFPDNWLEQAKSIDPPGEVTLYGRLPPRD